MTTVYVCKLKDFNFDDKVFNRMSAFRLERARKTHLTNRNTSVVSTLLLDYALKKFGLSERNMTYYENDQKKPFFANCDLFFSISHTTSAVAVAVSTTSIGVDIENKTREISNNLIKRFFDDSEYQWTSDDNFQKVKLWVAKESYVKYTGRGFSLGSHDITIPYFDKSIEIDNKKIDVFTVLSNYLLAVTHEKNNKISVKEIDIEDLKL